jgi:hypothetical protein
VELAVDAVAAEERGVAADLGDAAVFQGVVPAIQVLGSGCSPD